MILKKYIIILSKFLYTNKIFSNFGNMHKIVKFKRC